MSRTSVNVNLGSVASSVTNGYIRQSGMLVQGPVNF
jgi:hypothetical protein